MFLEGITVSLGKGFGFKVKQHYKTHSFQDSEPQTVISLNGIKNDAMSPQKLRKGIHISLTTTDPCRPSTAW